MKRLMLVTIVAILATLFACPVFAARWEPCARENQNCTIPGTKLVRYGADNRWITRMASHRIYCANEVFGDPAPGARKTCYYQEAAPPAPPVKVYPHGRNQPHWEKCANEGRHCNFVGQKSVRYGAGSSWSLVMGTNGIKCGNAIFGDPAPGVKKECYIQVN